MKSHKHQLSGAIGWKWKFRRLRYRFEQFIIYLGFIQFSTFLSKINDQRKLYSKII